MKVILRTSFRSLKQSNKIQDRYGLNGIKKIKTIIGYIFNFKTTDLFAIKLWRAVMIIFSCGKSEHKMLSKRRKAIFKPKRMCRQTWKTQIKISREMSRINRRMIWITPTILKMVLILTKMTRKRLHL